MLLSLAILCFNACVDKDFDLTLKEQVEGRKLMVLATLDNDLPLAVILSSVQNVDGEPVDYAVSDATVVLYENDLAIDTLERFFPVTNNDILNRTIYFSRTAFSLTDGAAYKVVVNAPGFDEAESSPVYFEKVFSEDYEYDYSVFDTLSYSGDTIANALFFEFGLVKQVVGDISFEYYAASYQQYLMDQGYPVYPFVASSQSNPYFNNGPILFGANLGPGTYIHNSPLYFTLFQRIEYHPCSSLVHHTQDYLRFAEPYTAQERELIGGLTTTPTQLPNNIIGGYGYFTVRDRIADCANP